VTSGYPQDVVEKVRRLLQFLDALRSHPFLEKRLALKGGTALNLFLWDVPRLSVDLDLNYVGPPDRDSMLIERPLINQAIEAVCSRQGIGVRHTPTEHAGGKWRLSYTDGSGRSGTLEVDMNFLDRVRLWPAQERNSRIVDGIQAHEVLVLDSHELAAGKLAALLARSASRDLYDAQRLLADESLEPSKLRFAFVVYGGMNRKDWREVTTSDAKVSPRDIESRLLPVLRRDVAPPRDQIGAWGRQLVEEVRDRLSVVLPLTSSEREFLDALNDRGEIRPELLSADAVVQQLLLSHPGLQWKRLNVRRHHGLGSL